MSDGDSPTVVTGSGGSSARRAGAAAGKRAAGLPQPGDRIDSFELEEAIGVGGMGAVFRALDARLDRHVALKLLPPEQVDDAEVVQRFYQEGRAAARLDHENIARVYTIGHGDGFHYIAFEFIEGVTIRHRVERDGALPVGEAVNYTLQIASALVHASERGVVHRDIKPSNIIITPQGRAKLVDMGLARRFERGGDDGLTQSGMTLGTFDYISPEQARDPRDVDVRSDLYSLGCTLFHMLSGRPPFPEGTVLQKLIQHQEEPPPDLRSLNPAVPADLSAIVMKLMAKERDRRYQTPEQLVRDLLILAGALGLRSVSPEGLLWMSAARPPAWERHLVWGVPVLGFVLVLAVLAWWGQEPVGPASAGPAALAGPAAPPKPTESRDHAGAVALEPPKGTEPPEADSAPPREIAVDSREDLLDVLAKARRRSTVVLTDDGPYIIRSLTRLADRDVTIKADAGVRPVLLLSREAGGSSKAPAALLDFVDGRVTLEGLELLIEPGEREDVAAIRAENTELIVRRCLFRRQGASPAGGRVAALRVRTRAVGAGGDRLPGVVADACHFDGGQVGILARGPVELLVRDSTLAGADPAFWFENPKGERSVPVDLRLHHDSILAGKGPVFRFEGTEPRVWVDDTAIAPAGEARATLVATDDPDRLDWRGRGNLLGRINTYLQATGPRPGRAPVRDAAEWSDALATVRETGSVTTDRAIWKEADPGDVFDPDNPTRAFRLAQGTGRLAAVGVRHGPFGTATTSVALNEAGPTTASVGVSPRDASSARSAEATSPSAATAPMTPPPMVVPPSGPSGAEEHTTGDMAELPAMPPMRTNEPTPGEPIGVAGRRDEASPKPSSPGAGRTGDKEITAESGPARTTEPSGDPAVLQTVEQFLKALAQLGNRGGLLRVAADADWELPGLELKGAGRWTIRAEPSPARNERPRLRFRPAVVESRAPGSWTSWLELRSGSLQLEGIDVVLARSDAPRQGRWAAFGVGPGADLSLSNCTVTVEGDRIPSAAVAVPLGDQGDDAARAVGSAATVRLNDSLVRAGGDFVEVAPGRRLDLDLNDVVVSTKGALVHAHGAVRGSSPEPLRLKLVLRQVTARMAGGLVQLESAPGEPALPIADVNARDSILATTAQGDPLFRVDGQDALNALRDRIAWEGHGVAYHQINTYRRDQSAQVGTFPNLYDRPSWSVAVGSKEESPIHGDVKFLHDWDANRAAWTLRVDDVKLADDSPAPTAGADPSSIPIPPPSGT